ncbi:MAG TPA: SRPBCC domain-containing protein [Burkholderiales bacterium]|nr:SRPBCC domain-containing protein [Burkholderiales bacterium]
MTTRNPTVTRRRISGAGTHDDSIPTGEQDRELLLTRVFDAPRDVVFRAWTDPEQLAQWYGPEGFTLSFLEMDLRPGGAWKKCMRSPEGKEYWRHGIYLEISPPRRIAFTYLSDDPNSDPEHETIVTVTFAEQGGKTLLTLRQANFDSVAARDAHNFGWTSCMLRFGGFVERQAA